MTTPRGAPELTQGQAVPETTVNEQIRRTEAGACHFPVTDRLTTPPGSCADGASYLITATATGAWTGKENQIATAVGANAANGWYYHEPVEGFTAYVQDEDARYLYSGSAWAVETAGSVGGATLDTDGTLAANSDARIPSQKAVKAYVDAAVTGLLDYKGAVDCSANPNYPAASKGDAYVVSVAGKIGGASGITVEAGDFVFAKADNAGGAQASVGASWDILQYNQVITTTVTTVEIAITDPGGSSLTAGDGKAYFRVPSTLNGKSLTAVAAAVTTASSSGAVSVQIANATTANDMLSTEITIDASETDTMTAATPAVINATYAAVSTGDQLRIDIDGAGTGAKGLIVEMQFQ